MIVAILSSSSFATVCRVLGNRIKKLKAVVKIVKDNWYLY